MNRDVTCPGCGAHAHVNLEKRSTQPKRCPHCKAVVYPATEHRFSIMWPLVKLRKEINRAREKMMRATIWTRHPYAERVRRLKREEDELLAKGTH